MEEKLKVFTAGARCPWCQIERIDKGFVELGCELVKNPQEADLIYVNNPWFENIVSLKNDGGLKGKIIFNILDIPEHVISDFDLTKLKSQLLHADAITSISHFVKGQIAHYLQLDSTVIYQPIMDVDFMPTITDKYVNFEYLFVGRKSDANKRVNLGIQSVLEIEKNFSKVAHCGHEYYPYGTSFGILSEPELSLLYNSVRYVFTLGKIEGISLPTIEAMACGVIPIVLKDMTTKNEFLPSWYPNIEPTIEGITSFINFANANYEYLSRGLKNHYESNLSEKFSKTGVAKRILDIYYGVKV